MENLKTSKRASKLTWGLMYLELLNEDNSNMYVLCTYFVISRKITWMYAWAADMSWSSGVTCGFEVASERTGALTSSWRRTDPPGSSIGRWSGASLRRTSSRCKRPCLRTCGSWARLRTDLATPPTEVQAWWVGKSMGRLGSPKMPIRGTKPFCTEGKVWSQ